jgi:hypothetical protein
MKKHVFLEMSVFILAALVGGFVFDLGYWSFLLAVLAAGLFRTIWQK